jgi:solute carrier family 39 (zinc transporter), member 9
MSTIGTGVLVGTALIVIIPEGVETLYSASSSIARVHKSVKTPDAAPAAVKGGMGIHAAHMPPTHENKQEDGKSKFVQFDKGQAPPQITERGLELEPFIRIAPSQPLVRRAEPEGRNEEPHDPDHDDSPHAWIGLSLILGFILMYLIDTLPSLTPSSPPAPLHISLHDLSSTPTTPLSPVSPSHTHSTTLGLTIHAVADGIALGATSASPSTRVSLGFVVFAAILLHKAPAAFGLTAVLLKQGLSKRMARAHLLLFSAAAPAGAIGTWALVNLLGRAGANDARSEANSAWWTGVVLIFSGGTFL